MTPNLVKIAAFLKRRRTIVRLWQRPILLPLLEWYWQRSLMGLTMENGRVAGVALIRIMPRAEIETKGWPAWYTHREYGDTAVVDLACATNSSGLRLLWRALQRRAPWCRYIAFKRGQRSPRIRIYRIDAMTRHILTGGAA